jgi:hypothetical protein
MAEENQQAGKKSKVNTVKVTSKRNVLIHCESGEQIYVQGGKEPVAVPASEVERHGDLLQVVE